MKFKKAVSAFAALTMAISVFASLGVTANAAAETATVVQMRSCNGNKGTFTNESDKIFGQSGPSTASSNYPGIGVVQLSYDNADSLPVSKATLTYKVGHSQKNNATKDGTYGIYSVGKPSTDISGLTVLSSADGANDGMFSQTVNGTKWDYSGVMGELTSLLQETNIRYVAAEKTVDVTEYISKQTAAENGKYYAAFAFSNATRGVIATDVALNIEYASADAVEKDITIKYVDEVGTVIKTETDKAMSGSQYDVKAEKCVDFDGTIGEDTQKYHFAYNAAASKTSIAAVDKDNDSANVITLSFTKTAYKPVTVNNVVGDNVIKSYTDEALVGSTYVIKPAQLGYKSVDGKYYFAKGTVTDSTVVTDSGLTINIPFEMSEENIVYYEDFLNATGTAGFVSGKGGSVKLLSDGIGLTQYAQNGYSDILTLSEDVQNVKKGTITFVWTSNTEGGKNRTSSFELKDSSDKVIISLFSKPALGKDDANPAGIKYSVGVAATDTTETVIANSGWTVSADNSGRYTVTVDFDFTGEKGKVSATIKGGRANADIAIPETEIDATNLAKIVATDIYSAVPQTLHTFKVTVKTTPVITTGAAGTVDGTSIPTIDNAAVFTNAADNADTATYANLKAKGAVLKTIYAKIDNPTTGVAPKIKIGDAVQTSKWTPVTGTNIYFAQFVGEDADFADGGAFANVTITYTDAADKSITW